MSVSNTPAPADDEAAVDGRELARFQKRLNLLAASLIVLVALIYLLQTFATVLQQLLVAIFIVYLIMPPYYWLVRRGSRPYSRASWSLRALCSPSPAWGL